ncbi:MAG: sugar phosphate isomerase/epimerase family protein [Candidatus Heimdallarchaeota archaeon]
MKIGASFLLNFQEKGTILEFLEQVSNRKLSVVEIVAEPPYCFLDDIDLTEREKIRDFAIEHNLELTVHGSFSDLNIGAYNDNVRNFTLSEIKKSIQFASDIGAKIVTIHPAEFGAIGHTYPEVIKKNNIESVKILTLFAAELDVQIGFENMPIFTWNQLTESYDPKEIRAVIESINLSNLGITWDVGHSNTTKMSMNEFYNQFKDHLIHIHLHDNAGPNDGWSDTHLEIGKGTIDWQKFFDFLIKMNYQGSLVFELNSWEKIDNSLVYLKNILK